MFQCWNFTRLFAPLLSVGRGDALFLRVAVILRGKWQVTSTGPCAVLNLPCDEWRQQDACLYVTKMKGDVGWLLVRLVLDFGDSSPPSSDSIELSVIWGGGQRFTGQGAAPLSVVAVDG